MSAKQHIILSGVICGFILVSITVANVNESPVRPQSLHATADQKAIIFCVANSSVTISWETDLVNKTLTKLIQGESTVDGMKHANVTFIVPHINCIQVSCIVTDLEAQTTEKWSAIVSVQGLLAVVDNLTSTEVDPCTLYFNWTAPYTLQGVPINYYTINITRHSDGAVLRTDTTNTTEYLYNAVDSLGETLKIVVAAVNDVGIGNVTFIMTRSPIATFDDIHLSTVRKNTEWIYTFDMKMSLCKEAINKTIVEACLQSGPCVNETVTTIMPSGDRVKVEVIFGDLEENKKYSVQLNVLYGNQSLTIPAEISTFDVVGFNVSVEQEQVCFTCKCVTGHTKPCGCFMLYNCSSDCGWKTGNKMIGEEDNYCNSTVLPAGECSIKATDADAWDDINSIPPFTLNNITTNNNQTSTCSSSTSLSTMRMATFVVTAIIIAVFIKFMY